MIGAISHSGLTWSSSETRLPRSGGRLPCDGALGRCAGTVPQFLSLYGGTPRGAKSDSPGFKSNTLSSMVTASCPSKRCTIHFREGGHAGRRYHRAASSPRRVRIDRRYRRSRADLHADPEKHEDLGGCVMNGREGGHAELEFLTGRGMAEVKMLPERSVAHGFATRVEKPTDNDERASCPTLMPNRRSRPITDFHRPSRAVSLRIRDGTQMVAAPVITVTLPRGTFQ
jgi:hypothetical protein